MTNLVEVYRGDTNTIETKYNPYPISTGYACLVKASFSEIIGINGMDVNGNPTNVVTSLNLVTETWGTSDYPNTNVGRCNPYCAMIQGYQYINDREFSLIVPFLCIIMLGEIFVTGPRSYLDYTMETEIYNFGTNSWRTVNLGFPDLVNSYHIQRYNPGALSLFILIYWLINIC